MTCRYHNSSAKDESERGFGDLQDKEVKTGLNVVEK